jgi:hypothetical protein
VRARVVGLSMDLRSKKVGLSKVMLWFGGMQFGLRGAFGKCGSEPHRSAQEKLG